MMQALHIGEPMRLRVRWIDRVPVPEVVTEYDGEVIGWRKAQVIIRVKDYNAVARFWKKTGLEVGNADHERRGLFIDPKELESAPPGLNVELDGDRDDSVPAL